MRRVGNVVHRAIRPKPAGGCRQTDWAVGTNAHPTLLSKRKRQTPGLIKSPQTNRDSIAGATGQSLEVAPA